MSGAEDSFVSISCPVCGGKDHRDLFSIFHKQSNVLKLLKIEDPEKTTEIVVCLGCGHRYMTPVVREDLMVRYYSILNSEFYDVSGAAPVNLNEKEYRDYVKMIRSLKPGGRVLEIGCGNGFLLQELRNAGYDCYGVEPSPFACDHARNKLKLNVENAFLSNSSFSHLKFDLVILIDVVEHITEMQGFIKEISNVLADDGMVFIGTGNIGSLNAKIAGPHWNYFVSWEHVSFFNRQSMHYLLDKNGFEDIKIRKTSLQHKPLLNITEFCKGLAKKLINPFLKTKYYHGICFDHFIVTAKIKKS